MSRVSKYEFKNAICDYFEKSLENAKQRLGYKAVFKMKTIIADANLDKRKFRKYIEKEEYDKAWDIIYFKYHNPYYSYPHKVKLEIDPEDYTTLSWMNSFLRKWDKPLDVCLSEKFEEFNEKFLTTRLKFNEEFLRLKNEYATRLMVNRILDYIESNIREISQKVVILFLKGIKESGKEKLIDSQFKLNLVAHYYSQGDYKTIVEISQIIDISKEVEGIIKNFIKKGHYEDAYKLATIGIKEVSEKISSPLKSLKTLSSLVSTITIENIKTKTDAEVIFKKIFQEFENLEKGKRYWKELGLDKFGEYEKLKLREAQLKAEISKKISQIIKDLDNELTEIDTAFLKGIIDEREYEKILNHKQELKRYLESVAEKFKPKMSKEDILKRIQVLNKLYDQGKISKADYEAKKKILENKLKEV